MPLHGIYPTFQIEEMLEAGMFVRIFQGMVDPIKLMVSINSLLKYGIGNFADHRRKDNNKFICPAKDRFVG